MKAILLILVCAGLAVGLGLFIVRAPREVSNLPPTTAESTGVAVRSAHREVAAPSPRPSNENGGSMSVPQTAADRVPEAALQPDPVKTGSLLLHQGIDTLVSPRATYQQKQAAWAQLRDSGKLDDVIREFEQRTAANKNLPEYPAALGQAYLQKAGTIQDIREQGILGMKADQSFDAALNVDGSNWEARFWKATAMSYWPPQLGKGKEIVEHCLELVKQQEVLPPQPQFAQTYVLLGDQYEKMGHADYASEIWKRGLGLFPDNAALSEKASAARQRGDNEKPSSK